MKMKLLELAGDSASQILPGARIISHKNPMSFLLSQKMPRGEPHRDLAGNWRYVPKKHVFHGTMTMEGRAR